MEKSESKGFKRYTKSLFNVSRWVGTEDIKNSFGSLKMMVKTLCRIDQPEFEETYEEAIKRLSLSNEDLKDREKYYLWVSFFYLLVGCAILGYGVFLFSEGHHLAGCVCLPLVLVMLTFFFKYHFWYSQIKYKKLGLTTRAWLIALLTGVVK